MTKAERIQKLLAFVGAGITPPPSVFHASTLPLPVHIGLREKMRANTLLDDRDVVDISFDPAHPLVISIFTALEDRRGKMFDRHKEEVPVFDDFLNFAIDVLRGRARALILEQFEAEERERKDIRASLRMNELDL
ncbi:MAG TPA: hypothetical protein VFI56_09180 [Vicinamibacterales bacterium]|nr:hypothetical protein [Vicinamibacterales bacterium]